MYVKIRKKASEPRDTVLTIRLSKTEQQELKKKAAMAGLSVGAFLLGLALGDTIGEKLFGDFPSGDGNSSKSTKSDK